MNEWPDHKLRGLASVQDERIEGLDFDSLGAELLALTAEEGASQQETKRARPSRLSGLFTPVRLAAGATALTLVVVAALWIGIGSGGTSGQPEFADAAVQVAEANQRLLVTEPGWKVTRADEFEVDQGEMEFSNGDASLQLTWYPASQYEDYYRDRSHVGGTPEFFQLLGERTRTVSYSDSDYATMLPPDGQSFIELRGDGLDHAEYMKVINSIEPTDVNNWLAAMPASVVVPANRAGVVDQMVSDMPLPPNFDLESLESGNTVNDRYQLGAEVSGAVACGWLDSYTDATVAGDKVAQQKAADALATARDWSILHEMQATGAYPSVLWEVVGTTRNGEFLGPDGHQKIADDPDGFRQWYRPAIC